MPLLVGTCGWSYDDWEGRVYRGVAQSERLAWYAHRFPTVEVDSTYYRDPAPEVVAGWIRKVVDRSRFELSVKAPQRLTHEALVDAAPVEVRRVTEEWADLVAAPLARAERLGAVLLQLSPAVVRHERSLERIEAALDALASFPVAVEFRNRTWHDGERLDPDALRLLDAHGAAAALVDGAGFPPIAAGSAEHAYVRFHGQNREAWFKRGPNEKGGRYDWDYSAAELAPWAQRLAELARTKTLVRIYFNNHVEGKAFRNATTFEDMLEARAAPLVRAVSPQRRLPL